jgi:DNA invertase Pin-like site-specific DNA recombinase
MSITPMSLDIHLDTKKVAAVNRVSSDTQTRADRYGLVEQREDIEQKVLELGRSVDDIIWFTYQESATDASNRPQFQTILSEIAQLRDAGVVDVVVFGRPDRLGRDGEDYFFHYMTILENHGKAQVRFGRDDIDPKNPNRRFLLFLYAFKARTDAETIRENTRRGRLGRARLGGKLPTGNRHDQTLFGYTYSKATGKREIDPTTNPILRAIGEKCLAGVPLLHISRWLTTLDPPVVMTPAGIRKLLRNQAIAGRTVSKWRESDGSILEIPLPGVTPPTFTLEEFQAIGRRLDQNRENAWYPGKQRVHNYPLTGGFLTQTPMLFCAECGASYNGVCNVGKHGGSHTRYYRHRRGNGCPLPWHGDLIARWVEAEIWGKVRESFANPYEAVEKLELEIIGSPRVKQALEFELNKQKKAFEDAQQELDRLSIAWAGGKLSQEGYDARTEEIETEQIRRARLIVDYQNQLATMKTINRERLLEIGQEIAVWDSFGNDWKFDPSTSESEEQALAETVEHFKARNGKTYENLNPDTEIGKRAWEIRRKLLDDLSVKVLIRGRELEVTLGVPLASDMYGSNHFTKGYCPNAADSAG